jgi:hypothetical protein
MDKLCGDVTVLVAVMNGFGEIGKFKPMRFEDWYKLYHKDISKQYFVRQMNGRNAKAIPIAENVIAEPIVKVIVSPETKTYRNTTFSCSLNKVVLSGKDLISFSMKKAASTMIRSVPWADVDSDKCKTCSLTVLRDDKVIVGPPTTLYTVQIVDWDKATFGLNRIMSSTFKLENGVFLPGILGK